MDYNSSVIHVLEVRAVRSLLCDSIAFTSNLLHSFPMICTIRARTRALAHSPLTHSSMQQFVRFKSIVSTSTINSVVDGAQWFLKALLLLLRDMCVRACMFTDTHTHTHTAVWHMNYMACDFGKWAIIVRNHIVRHWHLYVSITGT